MRCMKPMASHTIVTYNCIPTQGCADGFRRQSSQLCTACNGAACCPLLLLLVVVLSTAEGKTSTSAPTISESITVLLANHWLCSAASLPAHLEQDCLRSSAPV
jgi:hypothetical protein